jgi:hypothetical protein
MQSVQDESNYISITINKSDIEEDGDYFYAFKSTDEGIDDLYWISAELEFKSMTEGNLGITLYDKNDEVGSFDCDLSKEREGNTICSKPILTEGGQHKYDITCFFY